MSPSPCPSMSPSMFNIVSMVMDTLVGKMGCPAILSVKDSVKKDQRYRSQNGDVDGMRKRSLSNENNLSLLSDFSEI